MSVSFTGIHFPSMWEEGYNYEAIVLCVEKQICKKQIYKVKVSSDERSPSKQLKIWEFLKIWGESLRQSHPDSNFFKILKEWNSSNDENLHAQIIKIKNIKNCQIIDEIRMKKTVTVLLRDDLQREYRVFIKAKIDAPESTLAEVKELVDQDFDYKKKNKGFNLLQSMHLIAKSYPVTVQADIRQWNDAPEWQSQELIGLRLEAPLELSPSTVFSAPSLSSSSSSIAKMDYLAPPPLTGTNPPNRQCKTFRQIKVQFSNGRTRRYRLFCSARSEIDLKQKIELYQELVARIKNSEAENLVIRDIAKNNSKPKGTTLTLKVIGPA